MQHSRIDFIKSQSKLTRNHTLDLLSQTPFDTWYETPLVINSNIAWQVGHIIVSQFYHSIAVITKVDLKIYKEVPLKDYFSIYSMAAKSTTNELKPAPTILLKQLEIINNYSAQAIDSLQEEDLESGLEPTKFPHPIAKTKYEALTWSFRHEMWHLGQIAVLKRILNNPVQW